MASDLEVLVEMGFAEVVAAKALAKTRHCGIQPAMDWLLAHPQDDGQMSDNEDGNKFKDNEDSNNLNDNGDSNKFSDNGGNNLMDSKESKESIVPKTYTAQELAEKQAELVVRMAVRKEERRVQAVAEDKMKEKVRRSTGQEMQAIKEKLQRDEMDKEVRARKREKELDNAARIRVRMQLEQDRADRKQREKTIAAARSEAGKDNSSKSTASQDTGNTSSAKDIKDISYKEARIQVRLPTGDMVSRVFASTDHFHMVLEFVQERYSLPFKIMDTYPRRQIDAFNQTVAELGLCPSASLVVQPL